MIQKVLQRRYILYENTPDLLNEMELRHTNLKFNELGVFKIKAKGGEKNGKKK